MFPGTQPPAIGRPFSGATMNMPTSAAIRPRIMPHSHAGQVKRGISEAEHGAVQARPRNRD